jgi:hypothetical protein
MTNGGKPPSPDDVLEAIRRLVSGSEDPEEQETENAEAMTDSPKRDPIVDEGAEFDSQPSEDETGKHSRFVLTQSLRVLEERPDKQDENQPKKPASGDDKARQIRAKTTDETGADTKSDTKRISEAQESLAAKIAALEAVIERQKIDWEPDGISEEDTLSGAPLEPETPEAESSDSLETEEIAPETSLIAEIEKQPEAQQNVDSLDVSELQEHVAQIVRDELKGVLGEDITRSVRALVRREIDRALTIRDLS